MKIRKITYLPLLFLLMSCKPAFNKTFENAIKDVIGKKVEYDEEKLKESQKKESAIQFYVYTLDEYKDTQYDKMEKDYMTLCNKFDSIMAKDYNCTESMLKAEREHDKYLNDTNKRKKQTAHVNEFYYWGTKEGLCVEISIHKSNSPKENNFIDVTLSKPNK